MVVASSPFSSFFSTIICRRSLPISIIFFLAILLLARISPAESTYLKSRCGFQSQNYTIKWAYEPQTQNVVFVLKAKLPTGERPKSEGASRLRGEEAGGNKLITGIAFGSESHQLDFIGILAINDQLDLVSGGHTEGEGEGKEKGRGNAAGGSKLFKVSPVEDGGVAGAVRSISLKRREADGSVIAEFARPLSGGQDGTKMADLSGCATFFLVTQWVKYDPEAEKNELPVSTAVRRNICAIAEKCTLDSPEKQGKSAKESEVPKGPSMATVANASPTSAHRDDGATPEVAQSVDVSGKGDPCSFGGTNYGVQWTYNRDTQSVDFVMKQKRKMGQWWSAVGIGDNMSDMDIGVIFLKDGEPTEMFDYFSSSYTVPDKDGSQDWKLDREQSKLGQDDAVELHFSRKLVTNDADKDRSLDGCVLFQFAANGGNYGPGYRIHKHDDWPDLYKACDLKKRCIRQKRQSSDEEDNLPEVSHSTDEKNGEVQPKKPSSSQSNGQIGPNSSGDKVISLLMKSLGPQIVKTVSESEEANSGYKNATENADQQIPPSSTVSPQEKEATGSATIFPIIEEEEGEGNYTRENGRKEENAPEKPAGSKEEEMVGETKEGSEEGEEEGAWKPVGGKRQEESSTTTAGESSQQPTGETTPEGTSPQPAGEEKEQTYSTPSIPVTESGGANMPGGPPAANTGSPFSLNAFLGAGGEQQPAENLVPVGESGPTGGGGGGGNQTGGPTTSIVRVSGEATSAEKGVEEATTTQANGGRFGINQMLEGGGTTDEAVVEVGQNQSTSAAAETTTMVASTAPEEEASPSSTLASSTLVVPVPIGIAANGQQGNVPVGENGPSGSSTSSGEEGHPAEERPVGGNATTTNAPTAPPPSSPSPSSSSTSNLSGFGVEEGGAESAPTTYGVPETTTQSASSSSSPTTSEFELIASGAESNGTTPSAPSAGEGEASSSSSREPTTTLLPTSPSTPPSTTLSSSTETTSRSSAGTSTQPEEEEKGREETEGASDEEEQIYSTPAPQSAEERLQPGPSAAPTSAATNGSSPSRVLIDGGNANNVVVDNNNGSGANAAIGGNASTSARIEPTENAVGGDNALEKQPNGNGTVSTQSLRGSGSEELEERGIKLPVTINKCDALRPDLPICQSYMETYMERVKDWADRHGESMANQYPKACKLLSAVPHVPTLCCQIFADKCADHI